MRRLRRPLGVLLALVLLQLVVVESGYACRMPATDEGVAAAMADMGMPASAEHSESATTQAAPHDRSPSPCRFPWAPNGCQAMAPCSPAALAVASVNSEYIASAVLAPVSLELLAPPSLSRAPELPPPRA